MGYDLDTLKEIAITFYNFAVGLGVIFGGIWAYYRYVKGRLFSPQVELDLVHSVIKKSGNSNLLSVEVELRNTGATVIKPRLLTLQVLGLSKRKGGISLEQLCLTDNLVKEPLIEFDTLILEPRQTDWYVASFVIPKRYKVVQLTSRFVYDKKKANIRHFFIDLNECR